jgi:hypothetical protein
MNKKSFLFFTITGAIVAIALLNYFLGITYSKDGSFDIITGAFVEVFILTVFFEYAAARTRHKQDRQMEAHLKKIEQHEINMQEHITRAAETTQKLIISKLEAQQQRSASVPYTEHKSSIKVADQLTEDQKGMITKMLEEANKTKRGDL